MDPKFGSSHLKFSILLAKLGRWSEAEKEYQAFYPAVPLGKPTAKGFVEQMRAHLTMMDKSGHAPETWWAMACAAEGDRECALAWLRKAVAHHDSEFLYCIRLPIFDFLRPDARYVELMRGVGLSP
jgi:hypothetical protein